MRAEYPVPSIQICPSPPPPPVGVFLGIKNGPGTDIIFTLATDVDIAGLQFEITLNGEPVIAAFGFNLGLPKVSADGGNIYTVRTFMLLSFVDSLQNFAVIAGSATIALAVDSVPLSSTNGQLIDAVQVGFVDPVFGDEVCLLNSSVISGPFGVDVPYNLLQPPCVILGGTPPPPPPPPKKCPKPIPCKFDKFKPIGCLFEAELATESVAKLTQVLSVSNPQFAQYSELTAEFASAPTSFTSQSSSTSFSSQFIPLPSDDVVVAAAAPEDLLVAKELLDIFLCPISFCKFVRS